MKKITTTFIALLLSLVGCRSVKETQKVASSSEQSELVSSTYRIAGEWQGYDSTRRYWYYHTDSSFFYHPDSGLVGNTGILWVLESMHKVYNARQSYDSTSTQVQENHQINIQESVRTTKNSWSRHVILTVLGLLIVLLVWNVCKKWIVDN